MSLATARKRFRLATYRRPATWETVKRAAIVGAAVGTLAFKARGARKLAVKALNLQGKIVSKRRGIQSLLQHGMTPAQATWFTGKALRAERNATRYLPKIRKLRRSYDFASSRYGNVAKVVGAGGIGYAGMPLARELGQRRHYKAQMARMKPVPVMYRVRRRR